MWPASFPVQAPPLLIPEQFSWLNGDCEHAHAQAGLTAYGFPLLLWKVSHTVKLVNILVALAIRLLLD